MSPLRIYNLWKADQLGSNSMAVRSAMLHIAAYSLAEHGSSSAQVLQWQHACQVTADIFFDSCLDCITLHYFFY